MGLFPSPQPGSGIVGHFDHADNGERVAAKATPRDRVAKLLAKAHSWEGRIDRLAGRSDLATEAAGRVLDLHGFREPLAGKIGRHEHCDDPWCKFCSHMAEEQPSPHAETSCDCIDDTASAKHLLGWWGTDDRLRYFVPGHRMNLPHPLMHMVATA